LLGPASLFLASEKKNYPALILLCLGILLIVLTFSRSAWLALVAFLLLLAVKFKYLNRVKLLLLISACLMTIALSLYPLRELVLTRVSNAPVQTEQLSTFGRSWLNQQAMDMIRQHPITGVGLGSFVLELGVYAIQGAIIEPVHSLPLLVGAELGLPGSILIIGLFLSIGLQIIKAQTAQSILASATITGLGMISIFDHYLWTLAPGRLMLGLAIGLWAGSVKQNGA
jgi:O-antigen ligase